MRNGFFSNMATSDFIVQSFLKFWLIFLSRNPLTFWKICAIHVRIIQNDNNDNGDSSRQTVVNTAYIYTHMLRTGGGGGGGARHCDAGAGPGWKNRCAPAAAVAARSCRNWEGGISA